MIPKSKYQYILSCPAIETFTPEQKHYAFKLIWMLENHGKSTFHWETLQRWFGNNYPYLVRLFCDSDEWYSHDAGQCKSYSLKPEVQNYLNTFSKVESYKILPFEDRATEDIVDENGRTLKQPPTNTVLREDTNGLRKKSTVQISNILYIDYAKLQKAISIIDVVLKSRDMTFYNAHFNPKKDRNLETIKLLLRQLENILIISKNNFSDMPNIPVQYQELGCGRLQGIHLNPQNMVSEVRNYILSNGGIGDGVYDYDMSNCHFTLAYQLYNQIIDKKLKMQNYRLSRGMPCKKMKYKELSALKNYLENKDQVRNAIAVETGLMLFEVKVLIISIMYGKRLSTPTEVKQRDLATFFGITEPAPIQKGGVLFKSPTLLALKNDIDIMVELISKDQPKTTNLMNAMGKVKETKKMNKYKKLNHIMLGLESYIIQQIANKYKDNVLLLMFDGFVANIEIFELINFPQSFNIGDWKFTVNFEMKKL